MTKPGDITAPVVGAGIAVGADSEAGFITIHEGTAINAYPTMRLTVPEVDQLIVLLQRARQIVIDGVGDMNTERTDG